MSTLTVASSTNGAKPLNAVTLGWLGTSIDKLAELRTEARRLTDAERTLTRAVMAAMVSAGLPALRATRAVATLTERTTLTVSAALYLSAVGTPRAFDAMMVSVEKARLYLGESELTAIAERATTPVLRVDRLTGGTV